jgi:hypothetical protein
MSVAARARFSIAARLLVSALTGVIRAVRFVGVFGGMGEEVMSGE